MAAADLAIGAGGATTWERCCLGLPSLVVSIAENQRPGCEALLAEGVIDYLGTAAEATVDLLASRLLALARDPSPLALMSAAGRRLVDGEGAGRVVEALHQHALAVS
jgi:spore coat polysaccharide biosynthesis predicted glycosyltransferase SpsG